MKKLAIFISISIISVLVYLNLNLNNKYDKTTYSNFTYDLNQLITTNYNNQDYFSDPMFSNVFHDFNSVSYPSYDIPISEFPTTNTQNYELQVFNVPSIISRSNNVNFSYNKQIYDVSSENKQNNSYNVRTNTDDISLNSTALNVYIPENITYSSNKSSSTQSEPITQSITLNSDIKDNSSSSQKCDTTPTECGHWVHHDGYWSWKKVGHKWIRIWVDEWDEWIAEECPPGVPVGDITFLEFVALISIYVLYLMFKKTI